MALESHGEENILYMFRCHVPWEVLLFSWLETESGVWTLRTGWQMFGFWAKSFKWWM